MYVKCDLRVFFARCSPAAECFFSHFRPRGKLACHECWNERHRARLASLPAGDGAHRDIEQGKLGARREWQASRAQHARESRPGQILFFGQSGTMGRVQGCITPY